jgi:DNA polymerase I-like protein with 3'-5' exonuclease and polymerase domains
MKQALDLIYSSETLVFDIETTSLNTRKGQIIGFGLSNGTESVYVAHLSWDGEQLVELVPKSDCQLVLEALLSNKTKLICHNASFDLRFTLNYFGVKLVPQLYADSMLAKHTADENFPFGLKDIASNLWGEDSTDEQVAMKASIKENGGTVHQYFKADLKLLAEYCIKDCVLTWRVFQHYMGELEEQGLVDFFLNDEVMPLYREVTIPMELAGVPIDMPLLERTKTELDFDLIALEDKIQEELAPHTALFETWFLNKDYPVTTTGPFVQALGELVGAGLPRLESGKFSLAAKHVDALPDACTLKQFLRNNLKLHANLIKDVQLAIHGGRPAVNLSSKHHLKKIFFDTLKCEPLSRTPTGMPQVDDTFLESVKDHFKFVPLLQDYNKLVKIKGTYIDRFLEEQESGVLYPSFQQHRTVSGRYGSDMQQMPRKLETGAASDVVLKYNNVIRDLIISAPDSVLIGADYESLEPKVFSHCSGDEGLKSIFREGKDFYSTIAIDTEGLTGVSPLKTAENYLGKVNKAARQNAKAYALGIPYGLTGYKLQFEINTDQKSADALVESYLSAYPALRNFMDNSKLEAKSQGYVRSETGRIRHMPRAKELYEKHGDGLLDSLGLWKKYHEYAGKYNYMKECRKEYSNLLNNSINFKIQSLAASIVNRACIAIMREFKRQSIDAYIALQIHDEVVVHCKLADSTKVCYIIKESMENTYKISLPLVAEPQIATVYGETK